MRKPFSWLVVLAAFIPFVTWETRAAAPLTRSTSQALTFERRVAAQRAIEEVFWRHRIWPTDNAEAKPSLDAVMPETATRAKVTDYLRKSNALATLWHRPITGEQLQAELNRMARDSHDPSVLQELFDALGNDAQLVAETLARQALVERFVRNWYATDDPLEDAKVAPTAYMFTLPAIDGVACTNDTWRPTFTDVPDARSGHTAVWTGTEMVVWGGTQLGQELNSGARYNPATDTWTPSSTGANVPSARYYHSAVWTGTEMIIWGGLGGAGSGAFLNSGARYNPANDSWTPTSSGANVPTVRYRHAAIWTGTEMIIWGGLGGAGSGGRYNPIADTWRPTSAAPNGTSVPGASVVWTGTEMIVWGGGGLRYNPVTDLWKPTSMGANVPSPRSGHTAVWTGTEMIVWGGVYFNNTTSTSVSLNTGARYDPASDSWTPTSTGANVPDGRSDHSAVWTGSKMVVSAGQGTGNTTSGASYDPSSDSWLPIANSPLTVLLGQTTVWTGTEMIVWGGYAEDPFDPFLSLVNLNTGARYNPTSDTWLATSTESSVPYGRLAHTAIWTGSEMIVWGGQTGVSVPGKPGPNTGGRYVPAIDSWMPTSLGDGVPVARTVHSAVWTGKEMIVWGGWGDVDKGWLNEGGRYNPATDSWAATSTGANVPPALRAHAAVWTGREMIVRGSFNGVSTGGRYDPATDSWRAMSPGPSVVVGGNFGSPTYLWTGTEMIVWGGCCNHAGEGRYNPTTDSWTTISTGLGAPNARFDPSKVWTGAEMIIWGGIGPGGPGGRYNPSTDSWLPVATGNEPSARVLATAVWTGSEMVVWGGAKDSGAPPANLGGRYDSVTNSWGPTSIRPNAPAPVPYFHTAVFTGTEMIVWGGVAGTATGGGYCTCPAGRLFYRDADGDGFGDPAVSRSSCDGAAPAGYVDDYTDCNDAVGSAHPGASEIYNYIDDDCDGLVDEGASAVVLKAPRSI
jgi:N-acetylneuraminic acid mutarotase